MLWSRIINHNPATTPPIWLGYGDSDILTADGPRRSSLPSSPSNGFLPFRANTAATIKAIFLRHLDTLARQ